MVGAIIVLLAVLLVSFSSELIGCKKYINSAIASVIAIVIVSALFFIIRTGISPYEYALFASIIAIICDFLLVHLFKKNPITRESILKSIFLISIIAAVYSLMTYGQAVIHSDIATATLLSESVLRHKSLIPATWNYANGEIWIIGNLTFNFLPNLLIANKPLARMVGSTIYVLFTVILTAVITKKYFKDNSWLISLPLVFIGLWGCEDVLLYQSAYTSVVMDMILYPWLLYRIYENHNSKKALKYLIPMAILLIIGNMQGIRSIPEHMLPLILTLIVYCYLELKNLEKSKIESAEIKYFKIIASVVVPTVIGLVGYKLISMSRTMNSGTDQGSMLFPETMGDIFDNLKYAFISFFEVFGYDGSIGVLSIYGIRNLISITLCILLCFVIPYFQIKRLKNESDEFKFFCLFTLLHNIIMIMAVTLMTGKENPRYLMSSIACLIIISSRYIYKYWLNSKESLHILMIFAYCFSMVLLCECIIKYSDGWQEKLNAKREIPEILISEGYNKGYASYWVSGQNEIYSDCKVRIGGVEFVNEDEEIYRQNWLVDSDVYDLPSDKSFLILRQDQVDSFDDLIFEKFGNPQRIIQNNEMYIYTYDYDIATLMPDL